MTFTRIAASVSLLVMSAASASAGPAEDIGSAITVQNIVTAAYQDDKRNLAVGAGVRQQELIEVAADGLGELKFKDETKLALGPGSKMLLDKFVYDPEKTTGTIVMNMTKGAFRFVTGVAQKPTYVIKTPKASITVRGTIFDLFVQNNGETWLLLLEGGIEICNTSNVCRLHTEPGKLIRVTGTGSVGIPVKWSGFPGNGTPFDSAFPFVVTPPTFDPAPVFTRDALLEPIVVIPPKKNATVTEPEEPSTPVIKKKRKVVKVDDDDDNDEPVIVIKKKKRVVKTNDDDDTPTRPIRVTKSKTPKYQEEPGISGMDIVIGIGGGIGRGPRGNRPKGGNDSLR